MAVGKRSWFAYLSAGLGLLALLGVLCFHFPELLTSREFRNTYQEGFARQLLLFGLIGVYFTFRFVRRGYARFRAWREKRGNPVLRSSAA